MKRFAVFGLMGLFLSASCFASGPPKAETSLFEKNDVYLGDHSTFVVAAQTAFVITAAIEFSQADIVADRSEAVYIGHTSPDGIVFRNKTLPLPDSPGCESNYDYIPISTNKQRPEESINDNLNKAGPVPLE